MSLKKCIFAAANDEIMELLIGILCGVVLSFLFSFGPAFFGLIQNSIQYGFRRATAFALGISLSDVLIVFLMLTVLKNVDLGPVVHNVYVGSIAGAGIIVMGVHSFRKRARATSVDHKGRVRFRTEGIERGWQLMIHGFLLNVLNPFVWIYWISVVTLVSAEAGFESTERYVFFVGLLMASLGCDVLKCRLASLLQTWFTARVLNIFNRITGAVMVVFGVYLVVSMVVYQSRKGEDTGRNDDPQSTKIIRTLHNRMGRDTRTECDTLYLE